MQDRMIEEIDEDLRAIREALDRHKQRSEHGSRVGVTKPTLAARKAKRRKKR